MKNTTIFLFYVFHIKINSLKEIKLLAGDVLRKDSLCFLIDVKSIYKYEF